MSVNPEFFESDVVLPPDVIQASGAVAVAAEAVVQPHAVRARPARRRPAAKAPETMPGEDEDDKSVFDDLDEQPSAADADPVRAYLREIGRTPLLTAAEEVELAKRIEAGLYAGVLRGKLEGKEQLSGTEERYVLGQQRKVAAKLKEQDITEVSPKVQLLRELHGVEKDGERAKSHLLQANLRLVVSLAKRYTGHGMPFLDIIQEGNLGLIRAVEKFDYEKGYKFSTYATWWIRQGISRAMADQSRTIRLPVHVVEKVNKMQRIRRELHQDLGREPNHAELAYELDITEEKVQEFLDISRDVVSLDQTVGADDDARLGDFIEDDSVVGQDTVAIASQRRKQLLGVIGTLEEREQAVVRMRYGLDTGTPMTLDEIGRELGFSKERIRQVEREAMVKLRHVTRAQGLRDFLD